MTEVYTQHTQSLKAFMQDLASALNENQQHSIIAFADQQELSANEIGQLEAMEQMQRGRDLSFVVVSRKLDYESSDTLTVVPSVEEAHDLISFEEMQRDLLG
ncbi:MAG: hypothetical protein ISP67_00480 [Flavobacteriaceae bacterium]|nr:hypothetical protein [Flavobacteriaceae bacterium]